MIASKDLPKRPIDVPRKINHSPCPKFVQMYGWNVGVRHPRINVFHREIGIAWNQR